MNRTHIVQIAAMLAVIMLAVAACNAPETNPPPTQGSNPSAPPPAITVVNAGDSTSPPATTAPPSQGGDAPAATPVPEAAMVGPETFPVGVNPLTGLTVADPAVLNRRPLAIKISNFPRYVRPQPGLGSADMVWEHYAEGGTTRFTAIYLSNPPEQVGPLRSARLIDTILPEMMDAALVTSGGSSGTMRRLSFKDWFPLVISDLTGYYGCPPLCRESEDTNALYTNPADVWAIVDTLDVPAPRAIRGLAFYEPAPTGGLAGDSIRIDYSGEANTEWRYDTASGLYARFSDVVAGTVEPHFDGLTNTQITAANVVVLFVNHVVDPTNPEDYDTDGATGYFSTEVQLWATGKALVFRDGQVVEATWVRLNAGDMIGLVDSNNNPVPLKPGQTWFQPVGLNSEVTSGPAWYIRHRQPADRGQLPGLELVTQTAAAAHTATVAAGGDPLAGTPEPPVEETPTP